MKVDVINLHGLNIQEALEKTKKNLDWSINHGVDVLVLNHGKGHHSDLGFSVIKKEIRKLLKNEKSLKEAGYRVVYGESDLPIALTYDAGHTLIVAQGLLNTFMGGQVQQRKNKQIFSEEARRERKLQKKSRSQRRPR